jgi:FtsH-binding integral membrane protein
MARNQQARAQNFDVENQGFSVLERSCKDVNLPVSLRLDFIKKVYGLVAYMLAITFVIASPFIFDTDNTMAYLGQHPWIPAFAGIVFIGLYLMNMAVMFAMCFNCGGVLEKYFGMFKTVPHNFVFLSVVASAFGIMVGYIAAQYTAVSVCYAFLASVVIIAALTAYAIHMKGDVTGMGMYIIVGLVGLMLTSLMMSLFGGADAHENKLFAGVAATFFGFIIVYDTQLIFGAAGASAFSGQQQQREFEYTLDMYAFAAYNLYLDYINFLLYMLRLMGERRD